MYLLGLSHKTTQKAKTTAKIRSRQAFSMKARFSDQFALGRCIGQWPQACEVKQLRQACALGLPLQQHRFSQQYVMPWQAAALVYVSSK